MISICFKNTQIRLEIQNAPLKEGSVICSSYVQHIHFVSPCYAIHSYWQLLWKVADSATCLPKIFVFFSSEKSCGFCLTPKVFPWIDGLHHDPPLWTVAVHWLWSAGFCWKRGTQRGARCLLKKSSRFSGANVSVRDGTWLMFYLMFSCFERSGTWSGDEHGWFDAWFVHDEYIIVDLDIST